MFETWTTVRIQGEKNTSGSTE